MFILLDLQFLPWLSRLPCQQKGPASFLSVSKTPGPLQGSWLFFHHRNEPSSHWRLSSGAGAGFPVPCPMPSGIKYMFTKCLPADEKPVSSCCDGYIWMSMMCRNINLLPSQSCHVQSGGSSIQGGQCEVYEAFYRKDRDGGVSHLWTLRTGIWCHERSVKL